MSSIKIFPFNSFQVNTYVLYDETGECVIIDPACYEKEEEKQLSDFILSEKLQPKHLLLTHAHIDHILGIRFVSDTYGITPLTHKDSMAFLESSREYGKVFGFDVKKPVLPDSFLSDGDTVSYGKQNLKVIYTPGHAAGSLCFYHEKDQFLIAGDVLFQNSIGRTDLPTGDHDTLIKSILHKIMILPDAVKVFSGHGPQTTVGRERTSNPFLNGLY